jgi:hypothetical protein
MKRIVALIALLLLVGCSKVEKAEKTEPVNVSRFMTVEDTWQWRIVADRQTGVMYAVSLGTYNIGTFTLLVDADGKPLIYDGGAE